MLQEEILSIVTFIQINVASKNNPVNTERKSSNERNLFKSTYQSKQNVNKNILFSEDNSHVQHEKNETILENSLVQKVKAEHFVTDGKNRNFLKKTINLGEEFKLYFATETITISEIGRKIILQVLPGNEFIYLPIGLV
jgi:hypothetical protein